RLLVGTLRARLKMKEDSSDKHCGDPAFAACLLRVKSQSRCSFFSQRVFSCEGSCDHKMEMSASKPAPRTGFQLISVGSLNRRRTCNIVSSNACGLCRN